MDGLDGMPPLWEHTVQDCPLPLQQHTAKDAVTLDHGMQPLLQLQVTVMDAIKAKSPPLTHSPVMVLACWSRSQTSQLSWLSTACLHHTVKD